MESRHHYPRSHQVWTTTLIIKYKKYKKYTNKYITNIYKIYIKKNKNSFWNPDIIIHDLIKYGPLPWSKLILTTIYYFETLHKKSTKRHETKENIGGNFLKGGYFYNGADMAELFETERKRLLSLFFVFQLQQAPTFLTFGHIGVSKV